MNRILRQAVEEGAFPGCVWRVYRNGERIFEEAAGVLRLDGGEPVTSGSVYDLASVTKPFVSYAVLLLADRGKIDLHGPASEYVEELKTAEKKELTVHQLLTHTAGLDSNPELHKVYSRREDLYDMLFRLPLARDPGRAVAYTSIGYQFLGYIIERVTGRPLAEFMTREVFEPLGLNGVGYLHRGGEGIASTEFSVFRGRMLRGEVHDDNCFLLGGVGGHAGLFSDVEDVSRFGRFLLQDGHPLLTENMKRWLFENQTPGLNESRSCAFIVNHSLFGDWPAPTFSHTGFTGTSLFLVPEMGLVSVLLTNRVHPTRENQKIDNVRHALHEWLKNELKES